MWPTPPLGSLVEAIVPARDKPQDLDGPIPWVRIEDFDGKYLSGSKTKQGVSRETVQDMPLRVFPEGTVVCSCSCTMGVTAIVTQPLVTNQTFIGLRPTTKNLYADFLYYALQAQQERLTAQATGAIQTYLSREDFTSLRIPIPPPDEQRAIADYLDRETARVDALIAARHRIVALCEEGRRAVRDRAFVRAPGLRLKYLLSEPIAYGVLVPEFVVEGERVPMIRTLNLTTRGRINLDQAAEIPRALADQYRRTYLRRVA